ncbi:unannotated protein [freshwater metagenome]|uniref:Unannotated protein n=1 Tax=freshwater metagenome TaxID=449393 RepID=A0A6J7J2D9_9ZZZZ|nr:hypothetical protein [Actinomycetota bacterium]
MKQLTYRATVGGEDLRIRFVHDEFETDDPHEAMLDDPPRCAGAAGAHAWYAVVLAWHHRADRSVRWRRDVVREIVGEARERWSAAAEAQGRLPIHVFQDAARRRAEEHYAPAAPSAPADVPLPPALRAAVLQPRSRPGR